MLVNKYGQSQLAVSAIINETASFINKQWSQLLERDDGLLHPRHLRTYANALHDFEAPCNTIFRLIDCTIQFTCQPCKFQELAYTNYKKYHSMKYQAVVIPKGLIAHRPIQSTAKCVFEDI